MAVYTGFTIVKMVHHLFRGHGLEFTNYIVVLSQNCFIVSISADTDEIIHGSASHPIIIAIFRVLSREI